MRYSILGFCALLLFGFTVNLGAAGDEKKTLKPKQHWVGKIGEDKKKDAAPKNGYMTSQDAFEKLWNAWELKGKMPSLDFKKQIVFVQLAGGPNNIETTYQLDRDGNLTAKSEQTLVAGPGFGYEIDVLDREGIKTYKGKPIE